MYIVSFTGTNYIHVYMEMVCVYMYLYNTVKSPKKTRILKNLPGTLLWEEEAVIASL